MTSFLKNEALDINVAVCGPHGSGKSMLVEKLNNYLFTRAADKRRFRLMLTECSSTSPSLFSDFNFALFTFETTGITSKVDKWQPSANIINATYAEHTSRTCLVGTKADLLTPESDEDIILQCLPATVAHYSGLKYISSSSVTGAGTQEIASYIVDQTLPCPPPSIPWHFIFSSLGNRILDCVALIFALPVPENVNQDIENIHEDLNDDIIEDLSHSPECMAHNKYLSSFARNAFQGCSAYRITPSLIAKSLNPIEISNTVYARAHLTIPIPQPRYPRLKYWFVTDFVKGRPLSECWKSLGVYMKFRVACTLRTYISQMRRLTESIPGSPNGGHVHGHIFSFGQYSGPFASAAAFQRYIEEVTYEGWYRNWQSYRGSLQIGYHRPFPVKPIFPINHDHSLVFTHADISPSNLVLSDDGVLWIIDWATCGFYPKWVEGLGMHGYTNMPKLWHYLVWFAVGPPPKQMQFWFTYFLTQSDNYSFSKPKDSSAFNY